MAGLTVPLALAGCSASSVSAPTAAPSVPVVSSSPPPVPQPTPTGTAPPPTVHPGAVDWGHGMDAPGMAAGVPSPSGWYPAAFGEQKPAEKVLYLTFDDGPSPDTTPRVLSMLKAHDAHATFFVTGWAHKYKKLTRAIYRQGHALGNHTRNHVDLVAADPATIRKQLRYVNSAVGPAMGNCMRPPFGMIDRQAGRIIEQLGMVPILWTGHAQDWNPPSVDKMEEMLKRATHPGAVILLHDSRQHPKTLAVLQRMLPWWSQHGYRFETVPACRK